MKTTKAVITAAGRNQRTLALQQLTDRDGLPKSVLAITVGEAVRAGITEVCVIVAPGDTERYREAAGELATHLHFVTQDEPLGYGHAVYQAREFVGDAPFLHMVGDHIFVADATNNTNDTNNGSAGEGCCARQILHVAEQNACAVSGVQATRENLLPRFGAVGGTRLPGEAPLYHIERVLEKPTPTLAEQTLLVPGLRAGYYLCFFGMHVLTPTVMEILERHIKDGIRPVALSPVLNELAERERYLAVEAQGRRYALDTPYGLLAAQLALSLSGDDRDEVLTLLVEMLAQRN